MYKQRKEVRRLLSLCGLHCVSLTSWPLSFTICSCVHCQFFRLKIMLTSVSTVFPSPFLPYTMFILLLIQLKPCQNNSISHVPYITNYLYPLSYSEKPTSWISLQVFLQYLPSLPINLLGTASFLFGLPPYSHLSLSFITRNFYVTLLTDATAKKTDGLNIF